MTTSKDPFLPEPAILNLFRSDTLACLAKLKQPMTTIQGGGPNPSQQLGEIQALVHKIRGTAAFLAFDRLVTLLTSIENCLSYYIANSENTTLKGDFGIINEAIEWLKNCIDADNAGMVKKARFGDSSLDLLIDHFKALPFKIEPPNEKALEPQDFSKSVRLADPAMMELFKVELENQVKELTNGLLALESSKETTEGITTLMRAAHSLKGASRAVGLNLLSELAHGLEDYFTALQKHSITLQSEHIDTFLNILDFLSQFQKATREQIVQLMSDNESKITNYIATINSIVKVFDKGGIAPTVSQIAKGVGETHEKVLSATAKSMKRIQEQTVDAVVEPPKERILRVTAQSLNRLMGLAGESLVESRWLYPFSESLLRFKKSFNEVTHLVDQIRNESLDFGTIRAASQNVLLLKKYCTECSEDINERLSDLEHYINRNTSISDRLYREIIQTRMRAFADGIEQFPRMVRDIARQLHKKVRLEIIGKDTPLDRDILEKLITPLGHLLRNAVDHGIELPADRVIAGKSEEGCITIQAEHKGGMLAITLSDDGAGLNLDAIRNQVIKRGLAAPEVAQKLSESELMDFIFLPNFSSSEDVSDISGRGIGLNVVQEMVNEVSGQISVSSIKGQGVTFSLRLPLTLSVIHSLIVEIAEEPYAFPLGRIDRALLVPKAAIHNLENKLFFSLEGTNVGLWYARDLLGIEGASLDVAAYSVVVISDHKNTYGLIVDSFLGERELVVQELDQRLGKVPNISSGAFFEDGSPLLIFEVDDLMATLDSILNPTQIINPVEARQHEKSVLIADDSATVRELVCKIMYDAGYNVVGVKNGMDAWNALRLEDYDLLITDIDMPRMNGLELIKSIRSDSKLKSLPIIVISYKDRQEDKRSGLDLGADMYLSKGTYTPDELTQAVKALIFKR